MQLLKIAPTAPRGTSGLEGLNGSALSVIVTDCN